MAGHPAVILWESVNCTSETLGAHGVVGKTLPRHPWVLADWVLAKKDLMSALRVRSAARVNIRLL